VTDANNDQDFFADEQGFIGRIMIELADGRSDALIKFLTRAKPISAPGAHFLGSLFQGQEFGGMHSDSNAWFDVALPRRIPSCAQETRLCGFTGQSTNLTMVATIQSAKTQLNALRDTTMLMQSAFARSVRFLSYFAPRARVNFGNISINHKGHDYFNRQ